MTTPDATPAKRKPKGTQIGENLYFTHEGNIGRIEFDLTYRGGRSVSGKTLRVFSTEGNKRLPEFPAVMAGLNGYEKPE